MIKCRQHPFEHGDGVCASCLRDRLLVLIAAQSGRPHRCCVDTVEQQQQPQLLGAATDAQLPHLQQKQQHPPPLISARSVSPYASRIRSLDPEDGGDRCRWPPPVRFYSTPPVGPAAGKRKGFSIFSSLFRGGHQFRSEAEEQDCGAPSAAAPGSSPWFAALIPGRRKKKEENSQHSAENGAEEDGARRGRRRPWCPERGMSPVRGMSGGEDGSASDSGYCTESPDRCRRPAPTPMRKHVPPTHRAVTGFVVCLSPLVRASPRQSHVGEGSGAGGLFGVLGGHHCHRRRRHGPDGCPPATLRQNRSRKLADFGRFR